MTSIPVCQDLELAVDGFFPEFPIDTDTSAWVGLQMPRFSGGPIYRVFQKFVPILNRILRIEFNASLGKCKLFQVGNLSKEPFKAISN